LRRAQRKETGLSAPIPRPPAGAGGLRYFRFYPLRGPRTASLPFLGFGVLLRKTPGGLSQPPSMAAPASPGNGIPAVLGLRSFASQNSGGFIAAAIHGGPGFAGQRHPCRPPLRMFSPCREFALCTNSENQQPLVVGSASLPARPPWGLRFCPQSAGCYR
jgi:hypothetical protein